MLREVQEEEEKTLQEVSGQMIAPESQVAHTLVYETRNTALIQCDTTNKFIIRLFDQEITLNPCALIAFKKRIQDVDLLALLEVENSGLEIINLSYCDRIFAFSIQEILELRELLAGSFTMLELNSMIHKAIIRRTV